MNQYAYRPGSWQVIAEQHGMIAVPADTPLDRIETLSQMMRDRAPQLTEVIDVLTGGTITSLGSFAIALLGDDSARFAVRGDIDLRVAGAEGDELVSGAEISTWAERYIASPRAFALTLEQPASGPSLSVRSGVVLASTVEFGTGDGSRPFADAETSAAVPSGAAAAPEPADAVDAASPEPADPQPEERQPEDALLEDAQPEEPQPEEPATEEPEPEEAPSSHDGSGDTGFPTLIPSEYTFAPAPAASAVDDDLPDATVQASPAAAASVAAAATTAIGDHDGSTISLAELRRMRGEAAESGQAAASGPDTPTEVLPAVEADAAPHGSARLSTGQVVTLDRMVIIGRRPRATRASGDDLPHLVAVESPQQDISRSHLEIRPEGDSVVVIDLHTTNGSTLLRPGADPMRLHPGEHTLVLSGDVVGLGDGVTVTFEGLT